MAINYYFFDAKKVEGVYDRTYSSGDFTRYLEGLVGSGVFPIPSDSLQVYAGTGMQVLVKPGMGWINGHKMISDADLTLNLDAADVTLNRIDRVIFRLDMTNRTMGIYVLKGANASSPTAPALTRTQEIIEYSLATITINRQTTQIDASMIRDTRLDSSVCGMVQGLIQQVSTETLFNQWTAAFDQQYNEYTQEFNEWFETIKETLSTVVMWQEFKNVVVTDQTNTSTLSIGISQYKSAVDILNVYVNGLRLDSSEYTHDETTVTFTTPLDVIGTTVEFVVYKSVNGENAESVVGQVAQLQTDVTDLQNDVAGINKYVKQNVSIQTSAWQLTGGWYVATIQDENITSDHVVDVIFHLDSLDAATEAEVQNITESAAGTIKLYAKSIPTATLVCDYSYTKGVAA